MPDQLPNITFRRGGHPNPRKTILHQQVEDVQSIPVVCLLFAHHRRADLRRITNPQFMPIVTEHLFEPLRGEGGFYADADGSRQCSIKPLGLARAMLQAARYKFARRGIHHCDFLKPCVKITSYNQHSRSAPFLRALVEETATKSTRPEGADDVIQSISPLTGDVKYYFTLCVDKLYLDGLTTGIRPLSAFRPLRKGSMSSASEQTPGNTRQRSLISISHPTG